MYKKLKKNLSTLFSPRSGNEDSDRKEFILNVLLVSSIVLFFFAILSTMLFALIQPEMYARNSIQPYVLVFTFGFFFFLLVLSRKGFSKGSAHVLVIVFFLLSFLMGYRWGVDVNASLLLYALVIVMSGILVNTRFAFIMTGLIAYSMFALTNLQSSHVLLADQYWRNQPWQQSDTIMTIIIFLVICTVSWLSNREIERSLARAHRSEESLRKERDKLEITVEERTRELKEAQLEKIGQLYSLAEFGRLSSGLFHDLMNPLTAVSLNVEKAKSEEQIKSGDLSQAKKYLDQAFVAAQRMERFIAAVRKQIGKKDVKKLFSPRVEIEQVIDILSYKANLSNVRIILSESSSTDIVGDPVQWSQIMLNLISNGIDAYDQIPKHRDNRVVQIALMENKTNILCTVRDYGVGIAEENLDKVFEPFFTTKAGQTGKGTGIGLSLVKRMIEKGFDGSITLESAPDLGTTCRVILPK